MPDRPGVPYGFLVALLAALAALGGCRQREAPGPAAADATTTAPLPATHAPAASPARVSVVSVDLGNAVGTDLRVIAPAATFAPGDTIYATVTTSTSDPAAAVPGTLGVKWTHVDSNQVVHEEARGISFSGPGVTAFQISKPDGWPPGKYKVEVALDGSVVQSREYEVK